MMTEYFDREEALSKRRTRYALEEPSLWAAELTQTHEFAEMVASSLARVSGRAVVGLEDRAFAYALMWTLLAAVRQWHEDGYRTSLRDVMEEALTVLERGLGSSG
jgi:hypothetical protein